MQLLYVDLFAVNAVADSNRPNTSADTATRGSVIGHEMRRESEKHGSRNEKTPQTLICGASRCMAER